VTNLLLNLEQKKEILSHIKETKEIIKLEDLDNLNDGSKELLDLRYELSEEI
jgi:hypothetical protein